MLLPPGAEGPEHTHHDAEEAFFVLEGEVEVGIHRDGQVEKRTLGYRDMIVVPAGVPRSLKNNGDSDALFCVIIGAQKPQVPTYPETSAMHGITPRLMTLARRVDPRHRGGAGLGLAIARRLGDAEATVWLADIRDRLGRARRGRNCAPTGSTRTSVARRRRATRSRSTRWSATVTAAGPLYGLVNNAALADGVGGKAIHELSVDEWDRVLGVNLRGTFLVSRAVCPVLIANGGGRVVTIGSDAALYGSPRLAHYIASKGGVSALTRAMARDLGPHGITVNTVVAGAHRVRVGRVRARPPARAVPAEPGAAPTAAALRPRRRRRLPDGRGGQLHHRPAARRQRRLRLQLTRFKTTTAFY